MIIAARAIEGDPTRCMRIEMRAIVSAERYQRTTMAET